MFKVNDACIKCGLCAELCPVRIIQFERGQEPWIPADQEGRCLRCGQCVCFCPNGSCRLDFQPEEERLAINLSALPEAEAAEIFLKSRRSIRRYKELPVEEDLLLRILQITRFAPSASNAQPLRWLVIRDRKALLEFGLMAATHFQNDDGGGAESREHISAVASAQEKGHDIIFRGAPHLALVVVPSSAPYPEDGAIALSYFELAAHALGIGCCWAGYFTSAARENQAIKKALQLGPEEFVVGGQMFGYPKEPFPGKILPPRKKLNLSWI